jgi:hypothetical protein
MLGAKSSHSSWDVKKPRFVGWIRYLRATSLCPDFVSRLGRGEVRDIKV